MFSNVSATDFDSELKPNKGGNECSSTAVQEKSPLFGATGIC